MRGEYATCPRPFNVKFDVKDKRLPASSPEAFCHIQRQKHFSTVLLKGQGFFYHKFGPSQPDPAFPLYTSLPGLYDIVHVYGKSQA